MHQHRKTPLWVSAVAVIVAVLVAFLFGGMSHAADEESLQSAATQSANITTEAQSSSGVATGSNCHSRPISAEEIQTSLKTLDNSSEYTAYEAVYSPSP